jgi:hypothetical protein
MTAEPPQSPVTKAVRSLEVRWIFPGQLETAVAGWFGRFPAAVESREDTYPFLAPRHTVEGPQTSSDLAGAPGRIRTRDPLLRRHIRTVAGHRLASLHEPSSGGYCR